MTYGPIPKHATMNGRRVTIQHIGADNPPTNRQQRRAAKFKRSGPHVAKHDMDLLPRKLNQ